MSPGLPCPNPLCPHTFPAEAVAAGTVVCPRCRGQFNFRGPAAPAVPLATAVEDEIPPAAAAPPPAPAAEEAFAPGLLVPARPRAPRGGLRDWLLPIVAIGLFAAVLAAGGYLVSTQLQNQAGPAEADAFRVADLNYRFRKLDLAVWERQPALQSSFPCDFAYQRANPTVWMALAARDFKTRNPSDKLLLDEALARLRRQFQNFQYEDKSAGAELAGRPAHRLVFQGDQKDQPVVGEVSFLAYQGIGYWLVIWTDTKSAEQARSEFPALRDGFALLGDRPEWKNQAPSRAFASADREVQLEDNDGLWEPYATPEDYGDKVALVLTVNRKVWEKVHDTSALVLVYRLGGGVPLDEAKQALLERQKAAGYPDTKLSPWDDKDSGPDAVKPLAGLRAERLRVQNDKNRARFGLLAAGEKGGKAVAVFAECDPDQREFWESNFRTLIETLRVGG